MKNKDKILCIICARGGSKGLKNKNIKLINNKPLITHTIIQAKKSNLFSNIIVSTDSNKIINISKKYGAEIIFRRPKKYSKDSSPKIPVIIHAVKKAEKFYNIRYKYVIDLDPTSPLRKIGDITKSLDIFKKNKSNNLISVSKSRKNPYFNMVELDNHKLKISKKSLKKTYTRQSSPTVYDMNASIYIWDKKYLINYGNLINNKTSFYEMPTYRSIDIDTKFDFIINEYILKNEKLFK